MSGTKSCKAIVQRGKSFVEEMVELPPLGSHQILIKVHYAAMNPTDVLAFDLTAFGEGAVLGCDFAGTVEAVADDASRFSVGDEVAAYIWGGEIAGVGAFSEYCLADERIAFKVPNNISMEQAATIPLSSNTAYLALFSSDCLHLPQDKPLSKPILVWGGSSTVGSFTIQIATSKGIATVATSSNKNADIVRADGAKSVFDYKDPDVTSKIKQDNPDLNLIFDTIGTPTTTSTAAQIFGDKEGTFVTVRPGKAHCESIPSTVKVGDVFVFTAFPKEHSYRGKAHWDIHPENVKLSQQFFAQLTDTVSKGEIKPRQVISLGMMTPESVTKGVDMLRSGGVSNGKVCLTVV